jgi:hypothetical protein
LDADMEKCFDRIAHDPLLACQTQDLPGG